jgi:uncharacterized protein YdiU (UPF0061 family)
MNTDNVAISGEAIDYGPCAFIDRFAANSVFSSIDANGRYAYGRQPQIMHWNMARFAEALLPAIHAVAPEDVEAAKALVDAIPDRFAARWRDRMRAKLGLTQAEADDAALIDALFGAMEEHGVDFTLFFRALSALLRGERAPLESLLPRPDAMAGWLGDWQARLAREGDTPGVRAAMMDGVNPLYIPRNHRLEAALASAETGNLAPWLELLDVVRAPWAERAGWEEYARPAPPDFGPYMTFCGT